MNADCQRVLLHLDRELAPADQAHLADCEACRSEAATRERVRLSLRRAVKAAPVDSTIEERVRTSLTPRPVRRLWQAYAAAAVVLLAAGSYWLAPIAKNRMAESAYFRSLPDRVSRIMRVGLSDHLHCAAFRKFRKPPVPEDLPAAYRPVLSHVPPGYRVLVAHECEAQGRSFIHLAMRGADEKTVSLVMARKEAGESFATSSLKRVMGALPVFTEEVPQYRIAGFESGSFLVFIVSDMSETENRQLALTLAGPVTAMLNLLG